jgi:xanthine dehydrogenase YagR molybdenum-binding subunit
MATAAYPARRSPATVRAVLTRDGVATFSTATEENGGGTATAMAQIAVDALGLPRERVRFAWGDSAMTEAPVVGASQTAATIGPAVEVAACKLREALFGMVVTDERSALYRADPAELHVEDDAIVHRQGGRRELLIGGAGANGRATDRGGGFDEDGRQSEEGAHLHSFGVHFAEVEVDRVLGETRVTRWVSVMDCGRVLNRKLARSQVEGGVIFGIGMALMEKTVYDPRTGAPVNANLAEYHLPTCADIPEFDISFVEVPDLLFTSPLGHRGIGEIGITGVPAAIANAAWHATGVRVRELPISAETVMRRSV